MCISWVLQAEFGSLYGYDNVMLTCTHTHAAAGGFLEHFLYHITTWGFVRQSFEVLVEGIVEVRDLGWQSSL